MMKFAIVGGGVNGLMVAYHLVRNLDVKVCIFDQGAIPNSASASYGQHRLIHPWSSDGSASNMRKAHSSLEKWAGILEEIKSDGFQQTGVIALDGEMFSQMNRDAFAPYRRPAKDVQKKLPFLNKDQDQHVDSFSQFGVLFAQQILHDLVRYLQQRGVSFHERKRVTSLSSHKGELLLDDGTVVFADRIVLSAGYGTDQILEASSIKTKNPLPDFAPMRCHVVYVNHRKFQDGNAMPAWVSLGIGDMWGMPPLRDIPMKLGCGDFTRPGDPSVEEDPYVVGVQIVKKYEAHFPALKGLEIVSANANHWTLINNPDDYIVLDNIVIVTSDSGGGFKFAPDVASELVNNLYQN